MSTYALECDTTLGSTQRHSANIRVMCREGWMDSQLMYLLSSVVDTLILFSLW